MRKYLLLVLVSVFLLTITIQTQAETNKIKVHNDYYSLCSQYGKTLTIVIPGVIEKKNIILASEGVDDDVEYKVELQYDQENKITNLKLTPLEKDASLNLAIICGDKESYVFYIKEIDGYKYYDKIILTNS